MPLTVRQCISNALKACMCSFLAWSADEPGIEGCYCYQKHSSPPSLPPFFRSEVELSALLQYVANQLKATESLDLLVLREILFTMTVRQLGLLVDPVYP